MYFSCDEESSRLSSAAQPTLMGTIDECDENSKLPMCFKKNIFMTKYADTFSLIFHLSTP